MAKTISQISKKAIILICSVILIVVAGFASTVAIIIDQTDSISNSFTEGKIVLSQTETTVTNTTESDVSVYIRVAIVVNYQDKTDNTIFHEGAIEGIDYTVMNAENWVKGTDGFYYYTLPVDIGETTTALPVVSRNLLPGEEHKHEYTMVSTYVAVGIQANVTSAVEDKWGVTVGADGVIIAVK